MLSIDIVSDVICPWCFIGKRRLDQALASLPKAVETKVAFHPFLLEPDTPPEGADLRQRLKAKYGTDPDKMFARVEEAAKSSGITLDYSKIKRTPSTLAAHTLLRHALEKGTQIALADALFEAYFLKGKDIGDVAVLSTLAAAHGFEKKEAARIAAEPRELARTDKEAKEMLGRGVTGVPFFVFGAKVAVSGAQSADVLRGAIAKAAAAA